MLHRTAWSVTVLGLGLILGASGARAQDSTLAVYSEGSMAFSYQQWPFGSYGGSFSAEGFAPDSSGFPPGQTEGCGGFLGIMSDTTTALAYGISLEPDGRADGGLVLVRGAGGLGPGTYPVDLTGFTAIFGFIDNADTLSIPSNPDSLDPFELLESIVADHKLIAASGQINVSTVDEEGFSGTFSGLMADYDNPLFLVSLNNGTFSVTATEVTVDFTDASAFRPGSVQFASPNPFGPRTAIHFTTREPVPAWVGIYDVSGRLVRNLDSRTAFAGPRVVVWDARDPGGVRVPAGIYFYRIHAGDDIAAGKLVLTR